MRTIIGAYDRCCASCIERDGGFVAETSATACSPAWLPAGPRTRCRARRAGRARHRRGSAETRDYSQLPPARAGWDRHRPGRRRRPRRIGEAQERGVVGETPNLAARLQAIADPDTVVIAEGTRRLLGNLFGFRTWSQDVRASPGRRGPGRRFGRVRRKPLRGAARERPRRAGRSGGRIRSAAATLGQG